jgi:mannose-6-phosphate isomerase-like protein (cupin superfamily)
MTISVRVVLCVVLLGSMMGVPVVADAQESNLPTFTKGKFAFPVNRDAVTADWRARGYAHPEVKPYPQGWTKGAHTHPVHLVMTVVAGRMELLMAGQRFVVEPGDEIAYAAHTVHAARNLYEGTSQMMESFKR